MKNTKVFSILTAVTGLLALPSASMAVWDYEFNVAGFVSGEGYIVNASVKVDFSLAGAGLVTVNVTERQPLIRWEQGGGYTWISTDGIAFRPRGEMDGLIPVVALSAPPVDGLGSDDPLTPTPFISTEMVQALKGLVGHVPTGTPILYEKGFGFGWNDPRGWRVYFGTSASDVALKMRVYESMVDSLTQRGIRPAVINVMYPTAPYYRMSQ